MIVCCGLIAPRLPDIQSTPHFFNCQTVGADSVMISAIRLVHRSSYSSSVGKGDFSVAEVKAATREMGGRKAHTGSQRMSESFLATYLAHCCALYTARRQVVVVEAKVRVKAKEKADVKAKMLERCLLAVCTFVRTITATYLVLALALSPLAQRYRIARSEVALSPRLGFFFGPRHTVLERFGGDSK